MQVKNIAFDYVEAEVSESPPVGMSLECFGGNIGRSVVAVDYSRHDAARISQLQRVSGFVLKHCDEYFGGPFAAARSAWNYHNKAGSVRWTETDLLADAERHRSCPGAYGNGAVGRSA